MIELFWILSLGGALYALLPDSWKQKSESKSQKKTRTKYGDKIVSRSYNFPLPRNYHPAVRKMAKAAGMKPGEWLAQQLNATTTLQRLVQPKSGSGGGGGKQRNNGGGRREEAYFDM